MKSYTDIKQSKRLVEFLPLESADMCYRIVAYNPNDTHVYQPYCFCGTLESDIPCWSLAALIEVLPDEVGDNHYLTLDKEGKEYCCCYEDNNGNSFRHCFSDNSVYACVAMIEKLHKQKLL
jgi:hypothetical protein